MTDIKIATLMQKALDLAKEFEKETGTKLRSVDYRDVNPKNQGLDSAPVILYAEQILPNDVVRRTMNGVVL